MRIKCNLSISLAEIKFKYKVFCKPCNRIIMTLTPAGKRFSKCVCVCCVCVGACVSALTQANIFVALYRINAADTLGEIYACNCLAYFHTHTFAYLLFSIMLLHAHIEIYKRFYRSLWSQRRCYCCWCLMNSMGVNAAIATIKMVRL